MVQKSTTETDPEAAFVQAIADALFEAGYTRDIETVEAADARCAVGWGLKVLTALEDWSFLGEFVHEGGPDSDRATFNALSEFMIEPSAEAAVAVSYQLSRTARWYGDSWIERALAELPSASEIQRGRQIDHDIKARKEAAL